MVAAVQLRHDDGRRRPGNRRCRLNRQHQYRNCDKGNDNGPQSVHDISIIARPSLRSSYGIVNRGNWLILSVRILGSRLSGHRIAAAEPTTEIDIGACRRAERSVVIDGDLAANRAARPLRCRFARSGTGTPCRHAVSISARFGQKKVTGKPSLWSKPSTSVSGSPTTLVYEPINFTTKPPAIP